MESMSKEKIKLYKNSARNNSTAYKPYVPQYQLLGVEPEEYKSAAFPSNVAVATANSSLDNPRTRKATVQQPLTSNSDEFLVKGSLPNVGKSTDQIWASVDGDIVDDIEEVNLNESFIDNNTYISETAFRLPQSPTQERFQLSETAPERDNKNFEDLLSVVQDLENQAYLLIVNGVPLCSGPLEEIQDQAKALVFGEHELCDGSPIPVENLIVIKKVSIKMGLFLD